MSQPGDVNMLRKLGLADTPEDAFCNGFLISGLIWAAVFLWTFYVAIIPMANNCVYWPKPLLPFIVE
jgi:hypothetical protein